MFTRLSAPILAIAVLLPASLALTPGDAFAQVVVGLDVQGALSPNARADDADEASELDSGFGAAARAGFQVPIQDLGFARPELRFGFTRLTEQDESFQFIDARVGGRAGFGQLVQVGGYGHLGWTFLRSDAFDEAIDDANSQGIDLEIDGGFGFDVGLFLDVPVTPQLTVGLHGGLNQNRYELTATERGGMQREDNLEGRHRWFDAGVHIEATIF